MRLPAGVRHSKRSSTLPREITSSAASSTFSPRSALGCTTMPPPDSIIRGSFRFSNTVTSSPALRSPMAAVSPPMPAPTMMTLVTLRSSACRGQYAPVDASRASRRPADRGCRLIAQGC